MSEFKPVWSTPHYTVSHLKNFKRVWGTTENWGDFVKAFVAVRYKVVAEQVFHGNDALERAEAWCVELVLQYVNQLGKEYAE